MLDTEVRKMKLYTTINQYFIKNYTLHRPLKSTCKYIRSNKKKNINY